jgi:hypothetical protein
MTSKALVFDASKQLPKIGEACICYHKNGETTFGKYLGIELGWLTWPSKKSPVVKWSKM